MQWSNFVVHLLSFDSTVVPQRKSKEETIVRPAGFASNLSSMALGAQTQDVLSLVVRQGMNPVILGLIFGLAGTFAVGRLLAAQLYQISPYDPLLLGATAMILAVAALLACLFPARRATRIDPIQALRTE